MSQILAELKLDRAPVGRVFDRRDPDESVEQAFFAGWRLPLTPHRYWQRASPFQIDLEEDRPVLECIRSGDAMMISGDEDWQDYAVSARVRLIGGAGRAEARAGVVARYRTSRHYYLLALAGDGRAVLYCRSNTEWRKLAEQTLTIDRYRYYRLTLTVTGRRLRAQADDAPAMETEDATYPGGPAGICTNTRSRFDGVRIEAAPAEVAGRGRRAAARRDAERRVQDTWPQERLLARYSVPEWPHEMRRLFRAEPAGDWRLMLYNSRSVFSAEFARTYSSATPSVLGVADLNGHLLWGREMNVRFPAPALTDDGGAIVCVLDDLRIALLSLEDGRVLCEAPLPESCPFQGNRGAKIAPDLFPWCPANLRGTGRRADFVLKDDRSSHGGRTLWAYDSQLRPLWTARVGHPRYGHALSVCDVNGDGRDEILAGFHLFGADGRLLWRCREAELNDDDHVDEVHLGLFGPKGEPRACGTNGEDGFYLLDGANGDVISKLRMGHVQGASAGRYLHDRPGHSYCVGSRWGSFGILNVVDPAGAVVATWEPDNVSQGGPAVRWTGDGRDLIFLGSTEQAFGLWDGLGHRCVRLECPELPSRGFYGIQKCAGQVIDFDGDNCDELVFTAPSGIFIYKAEAR